MVPLSSVRVEQCMLAAKSDRLTLIDGKTGPRHVLLDETARELLASLAETPSGEWVFPAKNGDR